MKKFRKWAILALACLMSVNIVACKDGGSNDSSTNSSGEQSNIPVTQTYAPADTEYSLIANGATQYKILLPAGKSTSSESVTELKYFIAESTGLTLPVVTEAEYTYDDNSTVISLGQTAAATAKGISAPYAEFGSNGYYLKRSNKSIFLTANNDIGLLNGVYDFLKYQFGIHYYSYDELLIPHYEDLKVKDFDYKGIPDFETRVMGLSYSSPNTWSKQYEKRMRFGVNNGQGWINSFAHSHFKLLPKATYYEKHPDWYSSDGTQLCLTNQEMREEMVKVCWDTITSADLTWTNTYYFMLGQEDVNTFCECDRCTAEIARLGSPSGVMMSFVNYIADQLNPRMEENYSDIKISWITFAYGKTLDSPTKKVNGELVPYSDEVVAHENVAVMYAPLGADFYHDLSDSHYNPLTADSIPGWKSTGAEIFIWTYSTVFDNAFYFLDDYGIIQTNYRLYKDMGAVYIYEESESKCEGVVPFQAMSQYVRAQLMWDLDIDVTATMDEFMQAYYKDAAPYVRQYYNALKVNYKNLDDAYAARGEVFHLKSYLRTTTYNSKEFYPKAFLESAMKILDKGIEAANAIEDKELSKTIRIRVQNEKTSMVHHIIDLYKEEMGKNELRMYIEMFENYCVDGNITKYKEHEPNSITGLLNDWKTLIS